MTPALKASRGTKRRCQNEACGLPFYDLNRDAIVCPNCQTGFVVPVPEPRSDYRGRYARPFGRPVEVLPVVPEAAAVDEELVDAPIADQADADSILEVEEEGEDALPVAVEEEPRGEE